MMAVVGASQKAPMANPLHTTKIEQPERAYTTEQLAKALKSGVEALTDQLQVLTILDSNALSWPGVSTAIQDLTVLADMASSSAAKAAEAVSTAVADAESAHAEASRLRSELHSASAARDRSARDVERLTTDVAKTSRELSGVRAELAKVNQNLWSAERQRAELAEEVEKLKADAEFMDGEVSTLRQQQADLTRTAAELREELAGKRADVTHLNALADEQHAQINHLRSQLDGAQQQATGLKHDLEVERADKKYFEKECQRLQEESDKVGGELEKALKEVSRMKEWQDVVKRLEGEKLRDAVEAVQKQRSQADGARQELEKQLIDREERVKVKEAEVTGLSKQIMMLALQIKDLQKQLSTAQATCVALTRQRDDVRQQLSMATANLSKINLAAKDLENEKLQLQAQVREAANAERVAAIGSLEEARKEAALQKALADGWQRDMLASAARAKAAEERAAALQEQVNRLTKDAEANRAEGIRNHSSVEAQVRSLQNALETKELELRRAKFEASSQMKDAEKVIDRLQREKDASIEEIWRLRGNDPRRLPALPAPPTIATAAQLTASAASINDELAQLRRAIASLHGGNATASSLASRRAPPLPHRHETR